MRRAVVRAQIEIGRKTKVFHLILVDDRGVTERETSRWNSRLIRVRRSELYSTGFLVSG